MTRPLSMLEHMALGLVWRKGPCTPYAVMRSIATSKTQAFRSGAGSIYPLLKRMTEAGLMAIEEGRMSLTTAGQQELVKWVSQVEPDEVTANMDPLRARLYFLGALTEGERLQFLDQCHQRLTALREDLFADQKQYGENGDRIGTLAVLGAIMETEARMAWVEAVRAQFEAPAEL